MTEQEMVRATLIMLLKRKRQGMTPAARAKRKKPARWLYPWATEHAYATAIRAWVKPVIVYVREYIQKHHEAVLRGDGADAVIRNDAVAGQSFYAMIEALNGWVGAYVSDDGEKMLRSPIFLGLGNIADSTFKFNGTQYNKSLKSALGIEFPSDESWWPEARDLWRRNNYDAIRGDIKKYISDINDLTEKAVTNGWSVKSLMEEIQGLDDKISKSRAKFIARDQIGKLNGKIAQKRQEDIGLTMYEWSTSGDERVRGNPNGHFPNAKPSHYLMDGKLCLWSDSTVYSDDYGKTWKPRSELGNVVMLHPGDDIQCRCVPLAWFDELIDEADGVETGAYYEAKPDTPKDYEEEFKKQKVKYSELTDTLKSNMAGYEKDSLKKWTSSYYKTVNDHLRTGADSPGVEFTVKQMQSAIGKCEVPEMYVKRNADKDYITALFGGDGWIQNPKLLIDIDLTDKGFLATTPSPKGDFTNTSGGQFNEVVLYCKAKKGMKAAYLESLTQNKGERELLFQSGTKIHVLDVQVIDSGNGLKQYKIIGDLKQ